MDFDAKSMVFVAKKMSSSQKDGLRYKESLLRRKAKRFGAKKIFFVAKQKVLRQRQSSLSQSKTFWGKDNLLRRKAKRFVGKTIFFVAKAMVLVVLTMVFGQKHTAEAHRGPHRTTKDFFIFSPPLSAISKEIDPACNKSPFSTTTI